MIICTNKMEYTLKTQSQRVQKQVKLTLTLDIYDLILFYFIFYYFFSLNSSAKFVIIQLQLTAKVRRLSSVHSFARGIVSPVNAHVALLRCIFFQKL